MHSSGVRTSVEMQQRWAVATSAVARMMALRYLLECEKLIARADEEAGTAGFTCPWENSSTANLVLDGDDQ